MASASQQISSLEEKLKERFRAEKYQLVGRHSAVKKCSWLHESLVHGRVC
ncbi:MAG: 4-demethylwyosine synthase TYW1, partial [Candidatus Hecatellales archaeon]